MLAAAGFGNDNNRVSHLLMRAEIEEIIGSGCTKAGKQTYALLHERIPKTKSLKRDEAAAELARRYFTSHGPATLQDFVWWSGLPVKECRQAIEDIKTYFVSETIGEQTLWFAPPVTKPKVDQIQVFLLPAFDEFIISYKNRTASLPFENHIKAVLINGVFRPVIVQNGQVIGIWKRILKNDKVFLETEFFGSPGNMQELISKSFASYAHFIGKNPEIIKS
ncbi:MAG: winged helix DNA-binding domain-containing protein [Draconibacterium sp.]|nr:winged helix DNA-binding domain-containing protein [Draconibacterium sp.]